MFEHDYPGYILIAVEFIVDASVVPTRMHLSSSGRLRIVKRCAIRTNSDPILSIWEVYIADVQSLDLPGSYSEWSSFSRTTRTYTMPS